MKRFLTLLALVGAVACVGATAIPAAVVTNSTVHSEFTAFDPCTGEDVFVSGDIRFLTTSTVNENTISGVFHSVFKATGVGLTSGLQYQETVVFNRSFETSLQNAEATVTLEGVISVVAPGGMNNQYSPIFLHTTMNANGDVTSYRLDSPGVSCR